MHKYILLILIPCIAHAEFSFYTGLSFNAEERDKPEVDLPNPLGILRFEYKTEKETIIFCEHISSFPKIEDGAGLNQCGFLIKL